MDSQWVPGIWMPHFLIKLFNVRLGGYCFLELKCFLHLKKAFWHAGNFWSHGQDREDCFHLGAGPALSGSQRLCTVSFTEPVDGKLHLRSNMHHPSSDMRHSSGNMYYCSSNMYYPSSNICQLSGKCVTLAVMHVCRCSVMSKPAWRRQHCFISAKVAC